MSKKHYSTPARGGSSVKITAIIALLLALIVGAYVVLSLVFHSWNPIKWTDKDSVKDPTHATTDPSLDLSFEEGENNGITMFTALLPRAAYAANGVSARAQVAYNVTATVYPADAENKLVDWALLWADDDSTVTTHASLTIPSDGSLTVTLAVTEAFPDRNMKLVCTSRDSGASGYALVRCEGIPTDLTVEGSDAITNCRWGNTNTYAINLTNDLGYVGEAQYEKLTVKSVTLHGYIQHYDKCLFPNIYSSSISDCEAKGSPTFGEGSRLIQLSDQYPNALRASISGHNLVITMSAYPSATADRVNVGITVNGSTGSQATNYNSSPKEAYAEIVLQAGNLTKTIRVDFVVGVSGVSVGNDIVI